MKIEYFICDECGQKMDIEESVRRTDGVNDEMRFCCNKCKKEYYKK